MIKNKDNRDVISISNPLAQYDPDQPEYIPKSCTRAYKRSVYFPKEKAGLLYQISQIIKEASKAGTKMTFNDVLIEAIELWYHQNQRKYLNWLLHRLTGRKYMLDYKLKNLRGKSKRKSITKELLIQQEELNEAISQIEKFLYEHRHILQTSDYKMLIIEIIQSLKKNSSIEMKMALSKILARSDIYDLAAQVRHKPKIAKKKNVYSIRKDEDLEWYE